MITPQASLGFGLVQGGGLSFMNEVANPLATNGVLMNSKVDIKLSNNSSCGAN